VCDDKAQPFCLYRPRLPAPLQHSPNYRQNLPNLSRFRILTVVKSPHAGRWGERHHQGQRFTRHVNLQEVLKYFLRRQRRKVHPDFSDVQLQGLFFQVDPRLRGDWVEVRYDPFSPLETVLLYSGGIPRQINNLATQRDLVEAVHFLSDLLPPRPSSLPAAPAD
jgi:hypothetical protein